MDNFNNPACIVEHILPFEEEMGVSLDGLYAKVLNESADFVSILITGEMRSLRLNPDGRTIGIIAAGYDAAGRVVAREEYFLGDHVPELVPFSVRLYSAVGHFSKLLVYPECS